LTDTKGYTTKTLKVGSAISPEYRQRRKRTVKIAELDQESLSDEDYIPETEHKMPKLFTQAKADDLIRNLYIPKHKGKLLNSRLKEKNLVQNGFNITCQRRRSTPYLEFFKTAGELTFCCNIVGLLAKLGYPMTFIDSSKSALKAVLFHNGNRFPSIPVGYSAKMNKTKDNLLFLLQKIKYQVKND
jgi:hypothetical protein